MKSHGNNHAANSNAVLLNGRPQVVAEHEVLELPPPDQSGGKPLMQALLLRKSSREFSRRNIPHGVLSNLLWAAYGINRPGTGGRTAPSAHDWEVIDIYVACAEGLYRYDARFHLLRKLLDADIRARTGTQSYVATAPVNLVYVADLSRMAMSDAGEKYHYAGPDAGFIAQNVYLFCASEGLATVVRGLVNYRALAKTMRLMPEQDVILAQSVGYPATAV